MRVAGASLATEKPKYGLADQGFDHARSFQNRVIEWVREGTASVAVLRAPTGAGKTATFHELIDTRDMTLLVYPTNALLRQQRARFEDDDDNVAILDSTTLEDSGYERTENLLDTVDKYKSNHEVVVTNPDILQAIIQDMYRGEQSIAFFNRFGAVVYDEFHFYDALAASGLLLQIKILGERRPDSKILLASATPNDDFVDFVRERIGIKVCDIAAEYVDIEEGEQFRQPVTVVRNEERKILEHREEIAESLMAELAEVDEYKEPQVVLVFNSARDSNEFHDFLASEYPDVFDHAEKDNGFDTNDPRVTLDDEAFYILNTTSKGEVGLDYDVTTLYMENPRHPGPFLQRFGRAGRQSEATVHVYGLGQGPWGDDVDFPRFAGQIYEGLKEIEMSDEWLADLVGFRAAYALAEREEDGWFNQELREDFTTNVDRFNRWRRFIGDVDRELEEVGGFGGKYTDRGDEARLLRFTENCFGAFRGLRGRSLEAQIKYPRGDRLGVTTYDLTTTLRNYDIDHVEDENVFVVKPKSDDSLSVVTARLPEYESEPTKYDEPTYQIEDKLQTKIRRQINRAELGEDFEVSTELLHRFYKIVRITDAVIPSCITTAKFEIKVDDAGAGPPTIDPKPRQR